MGILSLEIVHMESACQSVLSEVRKSQQCRECYSPHASHEGSLLGIESVRPYPLVAQQMQCFVFISIVGFLEYCYVIGSALMEIAVILSVYRVDLKTHHAEILPGQPAGLPDVFHIAVGRALPCKNQYFLHSGVCDYLHLVLNLLPGQLHAADVVVAVESAVYAVIVTVVCYVQRREQIHRISEVLTGLSSGSNGHFLKKWLRSRGQQCLKVLNGAGFVVQRPADIGGGIDGVIIGLHLGHNLTAHIRFYYFHSRQVFHMVPAACGICFQSVLFIQSSLRQVL